MDDHTLTAALMDYMEHVGALANQRSIARGGDVARNVVVHEAADNEIEVRFIYASSERCYTITVASLGEPQR